jgi:hypothetical protein
MSPIDHLEAMSDRLSRGAEDIKKIADAAKPLYARASDGQIESVGIPAGMRM